MTTGYQQIDQSFLVIWVLVSTLVITLAATIFSTLAGDLAEVADRLTSVSPFLGSMVVLTVLSFLIGATLGLAQKALLSRCARGIAQWWASYSLAGWAGGGTFLGGVFAISELLDPSSLAYLFLFLIGLAAWTLAIGIGQWAILRQYVDRADWWLVASFIGWGAGIVAGAISLSMMSYPFFEPPILEVTLPGILAGLGTGLVSSAITGWTLVWMLGGRPA